MDTLLWEEKNLTDAVTISLKNEKNVKCDIIGEMQNLSDNLTLSDITKKSGIYKILNNITGKYYIGSSQNMYKRCIHHRARLRLGKHSNKYLQSAWNKHGESAFTYHTVEFVEINSLLLKEQCYLEECKNNKDTNYNLAYDAYAPTRGMRHTDEMKLKLSKLKKGKVPYKATEQSRSRLSKTLKGRKKSDECKLKMSVAAKRRWQSDDKK